MTRSITSGSASQVVEGHRLPSAHPPTRNERGWLDLLRELSDQADPPVTLRAAEMLRELLMSR